MFNFIPAPFKSVAVEIVGESDEVLVTEADFDTARVDDAIQIYIGNAVVTLADGRTFDLTGDYDGWAYQGTVVSRFLSQAIQDALGGFPDHADLTGPLA